MSTNYELTEIFVHPDHLFLDARNPRLRSTLSSRPLSDRELMSKPVQDKILEEITHDRYGVDSLVNSIQNSGFLNIDSIFVKELAPSKYLVLEGNRRTAALKLLCLSLQTLDSSIRDSVTRIPVKKLECRDEERSREIVSQILGIRHIHGAKEWEPMLQAFHIYSEYLIESKRSKHDMHFRYNQVFGERVARNINRREPTIRKEIAIVRIFLQLQSLEAEVSTASYSLLKMCVDDEALCDNYFQIDPSTLESDDVGLDRMINLMFSEDSPIKNPASFRDFRWVFKQINDDKASAPSTLAEIESGRVLPRKAKERLERRLATRVFEANLSEALSLLENTPIQSFRGVESELALIDRLVAITAKFGRIAGRPKDSDLEELSKIFGQNLKG